MARLTTSSPECIHAVQRNLRWRDAVSALEGSGLHPLPSGFLCDHDEVTFRKGTSPLGTCRGVH
eukprot:6438167-Prymnesium_polylepis.1